MIRNYYDVKFDPKTGGLQATHRDHQFDKNRGKYERAAADVLYKYGMKVVLESEQAAKGIKTPDGLLNDIVFDIKSVEGDGKNNIKNKFNEAHGQSARTVVLFFTDEKYFSVDRITEGYKMYKGVVKNDTIKSIFYILNGKVHRFK